MRLQVHVDMVAATLHIVDRAVCMRVAVACRREQRSRFPIPLLVTAKDQSLDDENNEEAARHDELCHRIVNLGGLGEFVWGLNCFFYSYSTLCSCIMFKYCIYYILFTIYYKYINK